MILDCYYYYIYLFQSAYNLLKGPDGGVGICYEHVLAEGPPIAALLDHVYAYW